MHTATTTTATTDNNKTLRTQNNANTDELVNEPTTTQQHGRHNDVLSNSKKKYSSTRELKKHNQIDNYYYQPSTTTQIDFEAKAQQRKRNRIFIFSLRNATARYYQNNPKLGNNSNKACGVQPTTSNVREKCKSIYNISKTLCHLHNAGARVLHAAVETSQRRRTCGDGANSAEHCCSKHSLDLNVQHSFHASFCESLAALISATEATKALCSSENFRISPRHSAYAATLSSTRSFSKIPAPQRAVAY
tara:strand:+ start:1527 stop:2270 length:744 start_codon:yes stop_codon:yes gene_type:complete